MSYYIISDPGDEQPGTHITNTSWYENQLEEAEEEFIKANKPQEAINMYEHKQDWNSALSVAR